MPQAQGSYRAVLTPCGLPTENIQMRCDGNEPVCAHCQRLGKLCTWVSTADCGAASRRCARTPTFFAIG
jgi:hypothetical protein